MSQGFEIIKVLGEDLLPLSPLSYEHRANGWKELRVEISTPGGSAIVRLIQWAETIAQTLRDVPPVYLQSPFPIRLVTKEEVVERLLVVPDVTWNLANFNLGNCRTDGIYSHTLLPSMERFALDLADKSPEIQRS